MGQELSVTHAAYLQHLADGRLMAARCQNCQHILMPPRGLCPACHHEAMTWEQLSGRGTLAAYTLIALGLPAMAAHGFDRQHPYCSGVVRLAEGPLISALIVGEDSAPPNGLRVGMPLKIVFGRPAGLAFQPA